MNILNRLPWVFAVAVVAVAMTGVVYAEERDLGPPRVFTEEIKACFVKYYDGIWPTIFDILQDCINFRRK